MLRRFIKSTGGNFAIIAGLMAVPLVAIMGLGIDYGSASSARTSLQDAVDAATLATAKESDGDLTSRPDYLKEFGSRFFRANTRQSDATVSLQLNAALSTVTASAAVEKALLFPFFGSSWTISSVAVAEVGKKKSVCVLTLGTTGKGFSASGSASFSAPNCLVHSNSTSSDAMVTSGAASASAGLFCAVGQGAGKFTPAVQKACPPMDDPFAYLNFPPLTQPCNGANGNYGGGYQTISPGVYCNGITLKGTAKITMSPGVYVIRDSQLTVGSNASLQGDGVVIILQGTARFSFEAGSQVTLKAPTTGDFAGVVIAQDKARSVTGESRVHGGGNAELTGSVYLPNQTMTISGGGDLGITAPQSAFVVGSMNLTGNGSAILRLNTNSDFKAAGYGKSALAGKVTLRLIR